MFEVTDTKDGWVRVAWPPEHTLEDVLHALCHEVYAHSVAIGMGAMHFQDGPLPEEPWESMWRYIQERREVHMDYLLGRCCKFFARLDDPNEDDVVCSVELHLRGFLNDHSEAEWEAVLSGAERRLTGNAGPEQATGLPELLAQSVFVLAETDQAKVETKAGLTVIELGTPGTEWGDRAVDQFDGGLVRVDEHLVNVAALSEVDRQELTRLAEQGEPLAVAAVSALDQQAAG